MSDNVKQFPEDADAKKTEAVQDKTAQDPKAKPQEPVDPQTLVEKMARGRMKLSKPIMCKGKELTELHYDFLALSGFEYADAMDSDAGRGSDSFHLTNRQALALFSAAVAKNNEDMDKEVVMRGLSIGDTIKAVQLATVFFVISSRAGNRRITRE